MKKLLAILLVLVLITSFCACEKKETKDSGGEASKQTVSNDSQGDTSTEVTTISLFGVPATIPDSDLIIPELEKRVGIDLDITSTGGDESLLVSRLAGGDIPDVFRVTTLSNLASYKKDGVLLDLKNYLDKMPNVKNMFTDQQWARVTFDGGIYGIPRRIEGNYGCWYIRYDWLDKLGVSDPTNFDELLEVAKLMTTSDLDGNGKNDTYAISGQYGATASTFGRGAFDGFWTAYGVTGPETIMIKDNQAVMSCTLPEFRMAVEEIRRFVDAGVVDPEILSNTNDSITEKMSMGKVGISYGGWANYSKPAQAKILTAVFPEASWGPFRAEIKTEYGVSGASNSASGNDAVYALNADLVDEPEKLEAVLKLFNYIATDECDNLLSFGIENEHYKVENDTIVKLEKMDELSYGWGVQFLGRQDMLYCMTKFADCADYIKHCAENVTIYTHYGQMVEKPAGINVSDIESYVLEQVAQFMFGTQSMDKWDGFIDTLYKSYSLQEYIDVANESLKKLEYIK